MLFIGLAYISTGQTLLSYDETYDTRQTGIIPISVFGFPVRNLNAVAAAGEVRLFGPNNTLLDRFAIRGFKQALHTCLEEKSPF